MNIISGQVDFQKLVVCFDALDLKPDLGSKKVDAIQISDLHSMIKTNHTIFYKRDCDGDLEEMGEQFIINDIALLTRIYKMAVLYFEPDNELLLGHEPAIVSKRDVPSLLL